MATLEKRNGTYRVFFRFQGRKYSKSLKTGTDRSATTDASGRVRFEAKEKGRYIFRTSVEEKKDGTDDGKPYQLIRHHGTLIMNLPL